MSTPTEEHPFYRKIPEASGSNLFILNVDWGWGSTIVASGMYEHVADWLISQLQGRPFPHKRPGVKSPDLPAPDGRMVL